MYSEFFGYQVNLIYAAIVVAFYDICHIVFESYNRVVLLIKYENTENGCLKDFSQFHCEAVKTSPQKNNKKFIIFSP